MNGHSDNRYESWETSDSYEERTYDATVAGTAHDDDIKKIERAAQRFTIKNEDEIIAVMGITGVGKSTFIERLTNLGLKIGSTLQSCTMEVGIHPFKHTDGRIIYLIDTPGFDDTNRTDTEVLEDVAHFLGATYQNKIKLAGIIYLHAINDNRMRGSNLKNLTLFQELCGTESLSNVVLATTMWDTLTTPERLSQALEWEAELRRTPQFWGDMIEEGSTMMRQDDGSRSALGIVNYIINLKHDTVLTIQRELIDDKKPLNETRAGEEVQKEIIKERKRNVREIEQIQEATRVAIEKGNERLANRLADTQSQYEAKLEKSDQDMKKLKADFEKVQEVKDEQHRRDIEQIRGDCKKYQDEAKKNESELDNIRKRQKKSENELVRLHKERGDKESQWRDALDTMRKKHKGEIQSVVRRNDELQKKSKGGLAVVTLLTAIAGVMTAGTGLLAL